MIRHEHISRLQQSSFLGLGVVTVLSVLLAFKTGMLFLLSLPFVLLILAWGILHYKSLYFFLLVMIPCSIEYYFSNGLATDLPTEPLMIGLMLITFALLAFKSEKLPPAFFLHPLILTLCFHYAWIFIAALNSENFTVSIKIFLAKTWYITTFTVLTALLIHHASDFKKMFWCIFIPLVLLTLLTNVRHAVLYQFSFSDVNKCVTPYFRNHVNYAAILSVFFPLILLARSWYAPGTWTRRLLTVSILFFVFAIYFSFTRTAMLALLAMIPFYFVLKWKLTRWLLLGVTAVTLLGMNFIMHDNHFMQYAPEFEATIYHDDFGSHVSSTFAGKDVSSMERVYRWVAALRMVEARPWLGVGPGNFFDYYKPYAVSAFETYISENEEHSTVHNYFLLMIVEQGGIGLFIFVLMTFAIFIYGQRIYTHIQGEKNKMAVLCLMLLMLSVFVNLLLSDMLETDKVGPFFFMGLALLVNLDCGVLDMENENE